MLLEIFLVADKKHWLGKRLTEDVTLQKDE